jgi:hypothetical protein
VAASRLRGNRSAPAPVEHGPPAHHSLALEILLRHLEERGRHRLLDLGPATSGNIGFFAGFSCKLYIADLHETLFSDPAARATDPAAFERSLMADLPSTGGLPVDAILAWDLLNYLQPEEVAALARCLRPLAARGTLLFTLISTHKEIPDRPVRFEILGRDSLRYETGGRLRRPSPRYKEPDLARLLSDYTVESSFLLRNGMQEYLLGYQPDRFSHASIPQGLA